MMNPSDNITQARRLSKQIRIYASLFLISMIPVIVNGKWAIRSLFNHSDPYWPNSVPLNFQMPLFLACLVPAVCLFITFQLLEKDFIAMARKEFDIAYPILEERREELKRLKDEVKRTGTANDKVAETFALKVWMRERIR